MPQKMVVALGELPPQAAAGGTGGATLALAGDDADAAEACRKPAGACSCPTWCGAPLDVAQA